MKRFFAIIAVAATVAAGFSARLSAAPPAASPDYGAIVSQSYDATQQVTETHIANGLTILTKESHASPVVEIDVGYKVGSRDEVSGTTGLSHILEHMMFKGTTELPAGAIDYLERQAGARNNAETGQDYTSYFELVASNRLDSMLRLEADRMEHSAFRPADLASEMTVVRSELEGDTNNPGYELYCFELLPVAFSAHPYRWPAIGFTKDVEAVQHNRTVIYNYYRAHYMPNNAVLCMVGDFKTKQAIAMVQKYFGVYPAGKLLTHHITPEPTQEGERRATLRRAGTTGEVLIGFHEPGLGTSDHYALDVMSAILSGGQSARLYQALVTTGIASDASAGDSDQKDPFLMVFDAHPQSGVTNDKVEQGLETEIAKLQNAPPSQAEVDQAIAQIDAQYIFSHDSVSSQAEDLIQYACISPRGFHYQDDYLKRIHNVTPAQIQDVAKRLFTTDNRTVAIFDPTPLPPGKTLPPPPSGEHFGSRQNSEQQAAAFAKFAKEYGLDNLKPVATTEKPYKTVLPNGLTLIVQENHANTTVALSGYVKAGSIFDSPKSYGTSSMTAAMLPRGTTTKSFLQLAQQLDAVGAQVGIEPGKEVTELSGQSLTHDFPLMVSTLSDELINPTFPQDELTKLIGETYSGLEQARQDTGGTGGAGTLADIAFSQAIYPKGHPYWEPSLDEQEADVKAITRDGLQDFYSKHYRPDNTVLVIVGDVTPNQAVSVVANAFGAWQAPSTPAPQIVIPDVPLPATAAAPSLIAIPSAPQTSIIFGFPGELKRTDKDYYATYLANYVLGGSVFGARLGHQIRDVDGLSYTIYSYFDAENGAGPWQAFAGTNPSNAYRALDEMKKITADYVAEGATPEELRQAKVYLSGAFPSRLETNLGVAQLLTAAEEYNLGLDYPNRYVSIINSVSLEQVHAAAKAHLHPDRAVVIMSGATPR